MNVGVVGLGSMGKRRIRLLQSNFPDINVYGFDLDGNRREEVKELFQIETYENFNELFSMLDAVFISTSPLSHSKLINEALKNDLNVFTEINLVDDLYDENIKIANQNDLCLFLSSTQLYRKEIAEISKNIKKASKPTEYIYHIGNYLPDWHPWENYKDFFVADRRTNGCREILAIELPWIVETFGKVKDFHVSKSKISDLEINYPDNFIITFEHENKDKGVLIVDLVSRKPVRNLEIINEDFYFSWDGSPDGFESYDTENGESIKIDLYEEIENNENYNQTIIEDAYLEEIKDFLQAINENKSHGLYSFEKDKYVLDLIDSIEG